MAFLRAVRDSEAFAHFVHAAKTGLAAALAFYLARFLKLPEDYWAAISAIIVMYSDVGRTLRASWQRVVGTAIGVTVGAAFVAMFGPKLWAFGVAVTVSLLVCGMLGFADAARLAGVAVVIVMMIGNPGRPWVAAMHRFLEVSFGVLVAVLFCTVDWPVKKSPRTSAGAS